MAWDDPDFLAEADAWIRSEVDPSGRPERLHVRPWSTVWRVPTSGGAVWFKANSALHRFEARLAQRLAAVMPDRVVELVATHDVRGWMLMRDAGTRLRDVDPSPGQLRHWERILPRYAELQLALAPSADGLVALGVPDHRLGRLPELLNEVLADEELLLLGQEGGVTATELDRCARWAPSSRRCARSWRLWVSARRSSTTTRRLPGALRPGLRGGGRRRISDRHARADVRVAPLPPERSQERGRRRGRLRVEDVPGRSTDGELGALAV